MSAETIAEHKATIARLAAKDLAGHVLIPEGEGRWLCRQSPAAKSNFCWFRVIVAPRVVIVVGDLGDAIFECSDRDSLAWLRGADGEYLLSKLRCCDGGSYTFLPGEALAQAREWCRPEAEPSKSLLEFLNDAEDAAALGDLHEHEWHRLVHEHGLDDDCHSAADAPSSRALWMMHALRTFVRLEIAGHPSPAADGARA